MKKLVNRVLTMSAESALEAALASLGLASHGGSYQPKEPEMLHAIAEECSETE